MAEKAFSLFLCILLVSFLFLPLTGVMAEGGGGNDSSLIGVRGNPSHSAPSRTGPSSPGAGGTGVRQSPASNLGYKLPVTSSSSKAARPACGKGVPYNSCAGAYSSNPGCRRYLRGCPRN